MQCFHQNTITLETHNCLMDQAGVQVVNFLFGTHNSFSSSVMETIGGRATANHKLSYEENVMGQWLLCWETGNSHLCTHKNWQGPFALAKKGKSPLGRSYCVDTNIGAEYCVETKDGCCHYAVSRGEELLLWVAQSALSKGVQISFVCGLLCSSRI